MWIMSVQIAFFPGSILFIWDGQKPAMGIIDKSELRID